MAACIHMGPDMQAGRESLVAAPVWAYPWVHRATRVALDLIEGTKRRARVVAWPPEQLERSEHMRQIGNPSSYQKSRSHLFVLLSGCVMTVAVWSCFAALLLVTGCTAPLPADSRSV